MNPFLTAQRIAEYAGIARSHKVTERLRKNGIAPVDEVSTGGRRASLYSVADVLKVYPYLAPVISADLEPQRQAERQERADKGAARRVPFEFERAFVNQVRDTYESQAIQANVRLCTEHVARQWFGDGRGPEHFASAQAMANYFYKNRIMNPAPGRVGYMQAEGWKIAHEAKFRKRNRTHKTLPTARYDYIQIGLSAGVLAPGRGAATVFVIDDRSGDSFTANGKKKGFNGSLPNAIYCFCGWSGKLLAMQETEGVRSRDIALCILKAALRYGVPDVVVLENSAAMKSQQLTKVVESLYTDSALAVYKSGPAWYKELFGGQSSPIVRNIPLIPRYPFKARAERLFRTFKEEHDAVYFPMSYQGGNRNEAVQLTVSTMPVRVQESNTAEAYYASIWRYANGLYMERNRPKMFPSFYSTTGLHPTVKNVWDAFGGDANAGTGRRPAPEKMAIVLYWLADEKGNGLPKAKAKAMYGRVDVTFDGIPHNYRAADLDHQYEGRRVAVVPVPPALFGLGDSWNDVSEYAAVFNIDNPEKPAFICVARNVRTTDYRDVKENRDYVKATRKGLKKRLQDADTRTGVSEVIEPEEMDEEVARLMRL